MAEAARGLPDTSVVVDHDRIDPALPFDAEAARSFARVFAATRAADRSSRRRLAGLLIAATAAANGLPLYTRNPDDFAGLDEVVTVVEL